MPSDQVVDVTEAAGLAAVAEDGQRPVLQRLAQEGRDRAAVVGAHPRSVGVEDADDRRVDALLAVVGHRQRLGVALRLVVDAARADRVDVAPVVLLLRMDLGVAVDLAGRGDQEAGALPLGDAEHVVGAVGADLERVQRQPQVVDRARRRGEVVDEVDVLGDRRRSSVMSMLRNSNASSRMWAMFSSDPVSRLSMQITRCPCPSRCSQRWDPRKPAPPVTTQVLMRAMLAGQARTGRSAEPLCNFRTFRLRHRPSGGESRAASRT